MDNVLAEGQYNCPLWNPKLDSCERMDCISRVSKDNNSFLYSEERSKRVDFAK